MGPTVVKAIPDQIINELAAFGPFKLTEFIQGSEEDPVLRFTAELSDGSPLPKGMICTADGMITGIPAKNTQGSYEVKVTANAKNTSESLNATFRLIIKQGLANTGDIKYIDQLKAQVWEALEHKLPIPDFSELYNQPITFLEIYYLLERWGTLTIWDAFNLEPMGEKQLIQLKDSSPHYHVYDRGSCLVGAPIDLFSSERTLEDGFKTARAMAQEVYRRQWTVELAGLSKFTRAAWVEIQRLSELNGKALEIINFNPTSEDVRIFQAQVFEERMQRME